MEEIAKALGTAAAKALVDAIAAGRSRREALDAAAEAVRREDLVSDELWRRFDRYVKETEDFEKGGG